MCTGPDLSGFSKEDIRSILDEVRNPVSVAVWGSENYYNLGSIIRTSHSFLVKQIWAIDCPACYERAAMGTEKWENIVKKTTEEFIGYVLGTSQPVVAFERRSDLATESLVSYQYPKDPILLFGSEKTGIPEELLKISTDIVSIPLFGIHNDLNLGVACGIALYDWVSKNVRT